MTDPGGGSGGLRILPSRPDACLRLKFLHRRDRISLFNWLIFLMKGTLHFATKQNSWDIKNVIVFGYSPLICSPLLAKQYFPPPPPPTANGAHRGGCSKSASFMGASAYGKGPKNYNVQPRPVAGGGGGGSFLNQSFDRPPPTPNQKFLDPSLEKVVDT